MSSLSKTMSASMAPALGAEKAMFLRDWHDSSLNPIVSQLIAPDSSKRVLHFHKTFDNRSMQVLHESNFGRPKDSMSKDQDMQLKNY